MTNGQRQKIKMLRYQGVGYGKIAKATGLSRDSVRNYCKREGLNGYAAELVTEYREVLKEEMIFVFCLNCGIELVTLPRFNRLRKLVFSRSCVKLQIV